MVEPHRSAYIVIQDVIKVDKRSKPIKTQYRIAAKSTFIGNHILSRDVLHLYTHLTSLTSTDWDNIRSRDLKASKDDTVIAWEFKGTEVLQRPLLYLPAKTRASLGASPSCTSSSPTLRLQPSRLPGWCQHPNGGSSPS